MNYSLITSLSRRSVLKASTAAVGGIALVGIAIPFIGSLAPSERARAAGAPVSVDLATLAPGSLVTVEWRGRPVFILHRTPAMLASLAAVRNRLADPASSAPQQPPYAANPVRAVRAPFLVLTAICTHLGCIPSFRPEPGGAGLGADWPGGFYCPCHGSKFDLAGRVFENVPAPLNMEVPPHSYVDEHTVLIGLDPGDTGA